MRLVREAFTMIGVLLFGIFMEIQLSNFWILFMIHLGLGLAVHVIRRIVEAREIPIPMPDEGESSDSD